MISGVPEKQSSISIMSAHLTANDVKDRTPMEMIRWQYWVTVGVVIKSANEGYDDSAVSSAVHSVMLLCSFVESHFLGEQNYFNEKISDLELLVMDVIKGKDDSSKARIIIECDRILRKINMILSDKGEKITDDMLGEM